MMSGETLGIKVRLLTRSQLVRESLPVTDLLPPGIAPPCDTERRRGDSEQSVGEMKKMKK